MFHPSTQTVLCCATIRARVRCFVHILSYLGALARVPQSQLERRRPREAEPRQRASPSVLQHIRTNMLQGSCVCARTASVRARLEWVSFADRQHTRPFMGRKPPWLIYGYKKVRMSWCVGYRLGMKEASSSGSRKTLLTEEQNTRMWRLII